MVARLRSPARVRGTHRARLQPRAERGRAHGRPRAPVAKGRLIRSSSLAALRAKAGVGCRVRTPEAERLSTELDAAGHRYRHVDEEPAVDATPEQVGELAAVHRIVLHRLAATAGLEEAVSRLTEQPEPIEDTESLDEAPA